MPVNIDNVSGDTPTPNGSARRVNVEAVPEVVKEELDSFHTDSAKDNY